MQTDATSTSQTSQMISIVHMTDSQLHYFTGLECRQKFTLVLATLGEEAHNLNYYYPQSKPSLSIADELLLTLNKQRVHPPNMQLSIIINLSNKQVSNVFITWINVMYYQWKQVDWWPAQQTTQFYAPSGFKSSFCNTRVILDGTECLIMRPKLPTAQQSTFSTYKNRNTIKIVVGATPGGLVSYISDAYGGSTSDRLIVERSALASMCDPGDELMVDKGFNIEDLFIPFHVSVNMPTFFRKKNRLSQTVLQKDRKVASKRVHIELLVLVKLIRSWFWFYVLFNFSFLDISCEIDSYTVQPTYQDSLDEFCELQHYTLYVFLVCYM
jgi:hypothetical protein